MCFLSTSYKTPTHFRTLIYYILPVHVFFFSFRFLLTMIEDPGSATAVAGA